MASHRNEVSKKETTKHAVSPLWWLRTSRTFRLPITGAASIGLILGLGLPAAAMPASAEAPILKAAPTEVPGAQRVVVSASAVAPTIERDSYTATSEEELASIRQVEAAAAQAALDAAAAEEARIQSRVAASKAPIDFTVNPPSGTYSGVAVVAYAEQFVGVVPYGYGNSPSDSFSCDGLVQYVFGQFGISLPRGVDSQAQLGIPIAPGDAQAGDLVVWPGQHIGIYDGNGGIIHSPDFGRMVTHAPKIWGGNYKFVRIVN